MRRRRTSGVKIAAPPRWFHPIVPEMQRDTDRAEPGAQPILVAGDPRLRQRARPIGAADAELAQTVAELGATLAAFRRRHGFGRAIAAPQIGRAQRVIAVDLGAGPFALVNPEIDWRSAETFELWDDCFSVPDQLVRVRRHASISLAFCDEQLRPRRWDRLPADLAELIQHEVDHLDGILFTDHLRGLRRERSRRQLKKLAADQEVMV